MSKPQEPPRKRKPAARNTLVIIGAIQEHALLLTGIRIDDAKELAHCHGERIMELTDELRRSLGKPTSPENGEEG